jgi:hypothetical protein
MEQEIVIRLIVCVCFFFVFFLVAEAYTQQGRANSRRLRPDWAARPALMSRAAHAVESKAVVRLEVAVRQSDAVMRAWAESLAMSSNMPSIFLTASLPWRFAALLPSLSTAHSLTVPVVRLGRNCTSHSARLCVAIRHQRTPSHSGYTRWPCSYLP